MNHSLDEILHDYQLRVFGEELTRVNGLPIGQRRAYVRALWESRVQRAGLLENAQGGSDAQRQNQFCAEVPPE